jgi:hypothetical protein
MTTAAPAPITVTVTLGPLTLPAFNLPVTDPFTGQVVTIKVPAGVKIPAGTTGTFPMPAASITFTADSPVTADSTSQSA